LERLFRVSDSNIIWFISMLKDERLENAIGKAGELEKNYDWLGAAEVYREALGFVSETDFFKKGQVQERIGCAFYRAAMQAESVDEFRDRMRRAIEGYDKTREYYGRSSGQGEKPRTIRCDAIIARINYWLASEAPEKKRLVDECWRLTKEALKAFEEAGDALEYGKTYNQLSSVVEPLFAFEWNFQAREKTVREAMERGERAIVLLSSVGDFHELARAFVKMTLFLSIITWHFIPDLHKREEYHQKTLGYWQKACELSKETAVLELLSGLLEIPNWTYDEILELYKKALDCAVKTKDRYLIGVALDMLAYASVHKSTAIDDPDKRFEVLQSALEYAERANHSFSLISFVSLRAAPLWSRAPNADYCWFLALWETDLKKKLGLLEKAVEEEIHAIGEAENAGYHEDISGGHHTLSKALASLAQLETNADRKRKLLEESLEHRNKSTRAFDQLQPFHYWNRGVVWNYLADLKAELSSFEKDSNKRKDLLGKAVLDKERALQLCTKQVSYWQTIAGKGGTLELATYGRFQCSHGEMLNRFYALTKNSQHQRRAIKAFEEAAESFKELDMLILVAECYWRIASGCSVLSEDLKAAESFNLASKAYTSAARKTPQFAGFYSDYALYMRAWAELEKSRHEHKNEKYAESREHYRMCSRHLRMTKKWSYLSSYYFAWSLLEHGEALSRLDKPRDAMKAFNEAGLGFRDSADILGTKARELQSTEERDEAVKLTDIAKLRKQYCMGRVLMEEAKLSGRKGDRISSAEKYASAAGIFEEIAPNSDRKEARGELQFASTICKAWEKMELAEERGNAVLYKKAAWLFAKAGRISPRKAAGFTAMGNSCFCEALELGMRFMATSNTDFYSRAKLRMENAASYYLRGGFEKPALLVEAAKRLFDAYVYVGKAETETEPEKKVRFYVMAEKCLKLAARLYGKAGYFGKKSEMHQSLERVRKERELAFSLSEVLSASTVLSNTTGVSIPDSTEKAVGLNEFESANIRACVSVPEEFIPGEEFEVKLDLVNVGKKPGLLVRVEGLVPLRCEVLKVPSYCTLEGASLNMGGRRLDPLSVESVSIWVLIADVVGVSLSPKVVYADELGNFRTIGAEETKIQAVVKFEHKVAQDVFSYLVNSFVEDRMKQRLGVEKSGWRSFPQIIKKADVSKRSLYGGGGRLGHGLSELQRKGLVDLATFRGERGRGGNILRVRIHYEKKSVRKYVEEKTPDLLT
jgi:hypothetical protein